MFFLFDWIGKLLYGENYDKYKKRPPKQLSVDANKEAVIDTAFFI